MAGIRTDPHDPRVYLGDAFIQMFRRGWTPQWAPISDGSAEPEIYNEMREKYDSSEGTSTGTPDTG